jgi:hypothetical protein
VIYAFIETQKANHWVSVMCRVLKVSKSQERLLWLEGQSAFG